MIKLIGSDNHFFIHQVKDLLDEKGIKTLGQALDAAGIAVAEAVERGGRLTWIGLPPPPKPWMGVWLGAIDEALAAQLRLEADGASIITAVAPATERRRSGVVSVPSMSETTALMGRSKGGSAW